MNTLERLAEGLWTVKFPFSMSGIKFGTRSTIVAVEGGLVIISPGPFGDETLAAIRELGEVRGLVAPNLMHHLFMDKAQESFPEAKVWLAPGLEEKRPDLKYDDTLDPQCPELWAGTLEQIQVSGMPKLRETAFFHRASSTLILTDLAFNFHHMDHWLTKLVLRFNGALGRFGPSRLLRHYFLRDEQPAAKALSAILEWPFERVVVAHGEILESGGQAALRQGYSWLDLDVACDCR